MSAHARTEDRLVRVKYGSNPYRLISNQAGGWKGDFIEPSSEFSFRKLAAAIYGRAVAYGKQRAS